MAFTGGRSNTTVAMPSSTLTAKLLMRRSVGIAGSPGPRPSTPTGPTVSDR
jgi:hypothetical protein